MTDIRGTWTLPTVRGSGLPLPPEEISRTIIEVSLDAGSTWVELAVVPANAAQQFLVPDAEIGGWSFRGTVIDTDDRAGPPVTGSVLVPDTTPPGAISDLSITLE